MIAMECFQNFRAIGKCVRSLALCVVGVLLTATSLHSLADASISVSVDESPVSSDGVFNVNVTLNHACTVGCGNYAISLHESVNGAAFQPIAYWESSMPMEPKSGTIAFAKARSLNDGNYQYKAVVDFKEWYWSFTDSIPLKCCKKKTYHSNVVSTVVDKIKAPLSATISGPSTTLGGVFTLNAASSGGDPYDYYEFYKGYIPDWAGGNPTLKWDLIQGAAAGKQSYYSTQQSPLPAGVTMHYRVRACNAGGCSPNSSYITVVSLVNLPPSVSWVYPASNGQQFLKGTTLVLRATASDSADDVVDNVSVKFFRRTGSSYSPIGDGVYDSASGLT